MDIYTMKELEAMSTEALLLYISELQAEVKRLSLIRQSKTGVFNGGSPQIVRDYVYTAKKLIEVNKHGI